MVESRTLRDCRRLPEVIRRRQWEASSLAQVIRETADRPAREELARELGAVQAEIEQAGSRLQEARLQVMQGVRALPLLQAEVLVAFYVNGQTIAGIAVGMKRSERWVKRCKAAGVRAMGMENKR